MGSWLGGPAPDGGGGGNWGQGLLWGGTAGGWRGPIGAWNGLVGHHSEHHSQSGRSSCSTFLVDGLLYIYIDICILYICIHFIKCCMREGGKRIE